MLWFLAVALTFAQGPAGEGAPMAEEVFKNVQILKGIPVDQFMGTMGFFSVSLGSTAPIVILTKAAAIGRGMPTRIRESRRRAG